MGQDSATRRDFFVGAGALGAMASAPAMATAPVDPLLALPGRRIAGLIAARKTSAEDVMRAVLVQIAAHNPAHNAIVALQDGDRLLAQARAMDARLAAGERRGRCLACRGR